MDATQLASQVAVYLTPVMPYLIFTGTEAAKAVVKHYTEEVLEKASKVWKKLREYMKGNKEFDTASKVLAQHPTNQHFQTAFAGMIINAFETHKELENELRALLESDRRFQEVIVEQEGTVDEIYQLLHNAGKQTSTIRGKVGKITQEQS